VLDGWSRMALRDFVTLQRGHDLPDGQRRPGSVPVLGSFGVTGQHDEARAPGPGVTVGRSGASFGVVSYSPVDYWPLNTALYVTDFHGNDERFAYYFLKCFDFSGFNSGSAQPSLNRNFVHPVIVEVPQLSEQRAIAHILGTLDDKIELNRRMSETLEAMARALFKAWFVDFDPVRAKAAGRNPCLPKALADLFPSGFVGSELGEVPQGWDVGSVYSIADVVYGAAFSSAQFNTEAIGEPLIRIRDLANESPGVWTTEVHPKGYRVHPGDIVVGMDGEFRAYVWGGGEAWLNQRVCVFVPKEGCSAAFVRASIVGSLAGVEATESATTVIHLGKSDIDGFLVVIPGPKVLAAYNRICQPWFDRIVAAKRESRTLAALRDTLLPTLISGELRVQGAEQISSSVVQ
jgi:type I restriction enzyme, S subunit